MIKKYIYSSPHPITFYNNIPGLFILNIKLRNYYHISYNNNKLINKICFI
jgi:hypothetical protein